MILSIKSSMPSGQITVPPSKSFAHRALIAACLASGTSVVHNISLSEDIKATISCLEALGAEITINGTTAVVKGVSNISKERSAYLNCNESGSTLRFFIPICLLSSGEKVLSGSEKLFTRPLEIYEDIAKEQDISFIKSENSVSVNGKLLPGMFTLKGNVSSQFITGLMFALPLLAGDSEIKILPPFESKPYVDMTADVLKMFGIKFEYNGCSVKLFGNQKYKAREAVVEGDWSNGAFLHAYRELGADVTVCGLENTSSQGDKICIEYFKKLKEGRPTLDLSDCPDLAPIMFAFAAVNNGAIFTGTDRLRLKESDRISAMSAELAKFGTKLIASDNCVEIKASVFHAPTDIIDGHNDHRVVMANAVLLSKTGGKIKGYEAVKKSYPNFFQIISKAGVFINYEA